jgi:uncharacterized membrane protein (DUF373 family)
MSAEENSFLHPVRHVIVRGLSGVEDIAYIGVGLLLAISALDLLWSGVKSVVSGLLAKSLNTEIPNLLDQVLLILLVVELMYTVQVSFRAHGLEAEPFIVVALIASVRTVVVIGAELAKLPQANEQVFRHSIIVLALLTVMVVAFVGSLIMLQKDRKQRVSTSNV